MMEMIVTGLISGVMGYLVPQPAWAKTLQGVLWGFIQRKFQEMVAKK